MVDAHPIVLTVSQLNGYVKSILDNDDNLKYVYLCGEISNFTLHRTGHLYFTIKDENSAIKAVMFSRSADKLKFKPENSMRIIALGRVSVYEVTGQYQFYVEAMQPDGIGALALAFEQLKEKLFNEGLFDSSHKKPIPKYPNKIGVITSPTGAAIEDIKNILSRRFKYAEVYLYPSLVQGDGAEKDLCDGLKYFNEQFSVDTIIIGRGGGSQEDLWAFNSERLAREVYKSKIPVISAVGHETDYTIIDFVADLRAETPSAAAEYSVPESTEQIVYIESLKSSLTKSAHIKLENCKQQLLRLSGEEGIKSPARFLELKRIKLDMLEDGLMSNYEKHFGLKKNKLANLASQLNALSPLSVLARGYSLVYNQGDLVKSVSSIKENDLLNIRLSDGEALCSVKEIK